MQYGNDDEDGPTQHHINQYTIKEEIGRGSYGSVHLATDQYGTEYVSEFTIMHLLIYDLHEVAPGRQRVFEGTPSEACTISYFTARP